MDEFIDGLMGDPAGEQEIQVLDFTDELVIGTWQADSCKLDDGAYSKDPAAVGGTSLDQVLTAEFREDHTLTITVMGETKDMGWSCQEGMLMFDDQEFYDNSTTFYWSDDVLEINVLQNGSKLSILCKKIP